jgi:hypothetical protein
MAGEDCSPEIARLQTAVNGPLGTILDQEYRPEIDGLQAALDSQRKATRP